MILVTSLMTGSLSSFVVRHEESKIWVVDDIRNQLLEIDIESKRSYGKVQSQIEPR